MATEIEKVAQELNVAVEALERRRSQRIPADDVLPFIEESVRFLRERFEGIAASSCTLRHKGRVYVPVLSEAGMH